MKEKFSERIIMLFIFVLIGIFSLSNPSYADDSVLKLSKKIDEVLGNEYKFIDHFESSYNSDSYICLLYQTPTHDEEGNFILEFPKSKIYVYKKKDKDWKEMTSLSIDGFADWYVYGTSSIFGVPMKTDRSPPQRAASPSSRKCSGGFRVLHRVRKPVSRS